MTGEDLNEQGKNLIKSAWKALTRGHIQTRATGNVAMTPGSFIVDANGIIQVTHYNKHAGDHPDVTGMLELWKNIAKPGD
jgi:hypothetical protein